jgi:cell division protein FtsI/penicillin-binding protein 2
VVAGALQKAYQQLDAADLVLQMGRISQQGAQATVGFRASVDLGSGGLPWAYQGSFGMRRTSGGWKVLWKPSVIVPGLRAGDRLAVLTSMPGRAQLQDSAGQSLARPSPVYVIGVRPDGLASQEKTATALASATGLDSTQLYGQIIAAPSKSFLALIRLRPSTYARLKPKLDKVPGIIVEPRTQRLFDSIAPAVVGAVGTETAQVLKQDGVPYRPGATVGLTGLQEAYQRTLTGSATTKVVMQDAAGHQVSVLKQWSGSKGTPVRTTLSGRVQTAADSALAHLPGSAAIVAVQPGSGRILAVATHQAGGMPQVSPLTGQYRPGQAFTIVSTAALLRDGFNPSWKVPCRAENTAGDHHFFNHPVETGLGAEPSFAVDFAHACGTAFAGLSMRLHATDLSSAAAGFGIGSDWRLQVSSFPGTIGKPAGFGEIAATTVGTADVRVSPLSMALAAGLVQSGAWHAPTLIPGQADPAGQPSVRFSSHVITSLRMLMRTTVTKGDGKAANVTGGRVYGQGGNAVAGVPGKAGKHLRAAWFVGYQGKIAFAVIEFARSPGVSAAPLAGSFLRDIRAGS